MEIQQIHNYHLMKLKLHSSFQTLLGDHQETPTASMPHGRSHPANNGLGFRAEGSRI